MTSEQMKSKLIELENHPVLTLNEEEIQEDVELIALKASVQTRLWVIKLILKRKEDGTTKID